jgi:two-component system sensor histidine kinase PilS (NtrC family)
MATDFNVRTWLTWLVKVRVIIITFLLGIQLAISQLTTSQVPIRAFLSLILVSYTLSLFFGLLLYLWSEYQLQAWLQIIADLAVVTGVIYLTGGIESYFVFLYPLVIVMASVLLPRAGAYITAGTAFVLFGGVVELAFFGKIPAQWLTQPNLKSLQVAIFINLFAFSAVAYLATKLVGLLRKVDVELQDKSDELENLQVLHERTLQSISSGVITAGLDGRVTLVNDAGHRLLEREPADIIGKRVWQLFLDRLPDVNSRAEVRSFTPKNQEKTFEVRVSALSVPGRGMVGCVYTFDDLTELRRLEREVRLRDRLSAVGRMAAGIAHEIRNPLSSIAGSAQMLSRSKRFSPDQQKLLHIVTRESERLNAIVSDFLDYSREKKYEFESADLIVLLEDTLTLLENHSKAVEIVRQYGVAEAWSVVDPDKMKQVFWNIGKNAVAAMPDGGTLTIAVRASDRHWLISFADTGIGFDPIKAEKIFEPFVSYFEGGTGLGLAIVYQVLQAHQAHISVNSVPGQGTEFVIQIRQAPNVSSEQSWRKTAGAKVLHG